jgi:hypothetical protein
MFLRLACAHEDKQEQRSVVMKSETAHLPPGSAVDDVDGLIAWSIGGGIKCSDPITKVSLVFLLWAEGEIANFGVKPIGANDQVEAPLTAMLEDAWNKLIAQLWTIMSVACEAGVMGPDQRALVLHMINVQRAASCARGQGRRGRYTIMATALKHV